MDIGSIISSPTRDKDWLKKCALVGLFALIPIAGALNLLGWMKATYERAKVGDTTLPEADLSYMGSGWALFLAVLPAMLVVFGWNIIVVVLSALKLGALVNLANLIGMLLGLVVNLVVVPALMYRHVVHGKGFSDGFDFADIMRVITSNTSSFVTFALVAFLASLIGGLGAAACCIGIVLTLPFGAVISANNILAFEQQSGL